MRKIGFYPVVDSYQWMKQLIPLGVPSIQLRIKNKSLDIVEQEIIASNQLARQYNCQLFINDYWQLAIKHKVFGVHLGQEDCATTDIKAIQTSNLKLGISTHNGSEINNALQLEPDYIAYGPIYDTTTKIMKTSARGLERLTYWVEAINLPIVAIGGINLERLDGVLDTGVDGVAIVSAVTQAADYQQVVKKFLTNMQSISITEPAV